MSVKKIIKTETLTIRVTGALKDRLKELNIDVQDTVRTALHKEIKKVERFGDLKKMVENRGINVRKNNSRGR